uniref:Trem-like transcript 2 protein n=1 Tax=Oryctolagus cuniculus TaxID=9986 RepID=G1SSP7_RABIT
MAPVVLLLLLLLWPQGCISGPPAEGGYVKVRHQEGETLFVQCSYKGRRNRVEGKVWCRIWKKRCEPGFTRVWAKGPSYLMQDDAQAKVVNITMQGLKLQDSGRYWCLRNSSGTLYPMMGIQLEVFPASTTERSIPLTHLANVPKSGAVIATDQASTSGTGAGTPLSTGVMVFTSGVLTVGRLSSSSASQTTRPSSPNTSITTVGPWRATGSRAVTAAPSTAQATPASPAPMSTKPGLLGTSSPTTGMCQNKLPSLRHQDIHITVLVVVLALFPAPVTLIVVYGFWKKRHTGSYSLCHDPARPWRDLPRSPEPLQKLA